MITSWFIENFLAASVLTLVILTVQRGLRSRPALKHALWLLVLVKLVTPPVYNWPWAIEVTSPQESKVVAENVKTEEKAEDNRWEPEQNEMTSISGSESALPVFDSPAPIDRTFLQPSDSQKNFTLFENPLNSKTSKENVGIDGEPQRMASETVFENSPRQLWFVWGLGIWIAGTVLFVLIQSTRIVRTMLLLRNLSPVPESLENKLEDDARRLGVKCPDIVAVAGIKTPLIWAVGRARLLWPLELALESSEWNEMKRWRGVLIHELAHLHRRDHWVGWLELLAGLVWWWNPFFWIARRQLRENAELACDAWVVDCLPEERRNYAETLLEVCQLKSRSVMPWPVVGASLRDRRSLERRLEMILKDHVTLRIPKLGVMAVLVLAVMALPGWSQNKKTDDPVVSKTKSNPLVVQHKPVLASVVVKALKSPVVVDALEPQSSKKRRANQQGVRRLEKQIADLQKQLRNLKSGKISKSSQRTAGDTLSKNLDQSRPWNLKRNIAAKNSIAQSYYLLRGGPVLRSGKSYVVESQTFSRVKYRLPKDAKKAKAVTDFVKAMFGEDGDKKKTHSIESGDDNTLTVMASSAVQSQISTIIQMAFGDSNSSNLSWRVAPPSAAAFYNRLNHKKDAPKPKKGSKKR